MAVSINKKAKPTKSGKAQGKVAMPATPSEKTFKRIYEMKEEHRAAMNSMFYENVSVARIIQTMKEGWGLFKDVSDSALSKYLYRYKWEVIDKQLAVPAKVLEKEEKKASAMLVAARNQIDALEEAAQLVVVQKARVQKLLVRENTMPMLFNQLGTEMKTLATFIQQYSNLAFELGIMVRVPKTSTITGPKGEVTQIVESDGRDRVLFHMENAKQLEEAAADFMRVLEGELVEVQEDQGDS